MDVINGWPLKACYSLVTIESPSGLNSIEGATTENAVEAFAGGPYGSAHTSD